MEIKGSNITINVPHLKVSPTMMKLDEDEIILDTDEFTMRFMKQYLDNPHDFIFGKSDSMNLLDITIDEMIRREFPRVNMNLKDMFTNLNGINLVRVEEIKRVATVLGYWRLKMALVDGVILRDEVNHGKQRPVYDTYFYMSMTH